MTKSGYPYPPDEFDVAVPGGAPVGVHRAPRSGWSSAWPFLLVAVVCAAVAWGGITLLSGGDDPAEAQGGASSSASASASAGPSEEASGEASSPPSGEPSATASEPATTEYPGDPAAADMAAVIGVYNDSGEGGVAAAIATNLASAGFTGTINAGNAGDPNAPAPGAFAENTVLYGPERGDTASAVAQALDIPAANVQESAEVGAHPTEAIQVFMATPPAG
ncbi:LytR C-terminal domain-containing protein [Promicromonospora vindobonensis]|uniref:LytR C-terminal domain-containing protein n=1 Tax=Promicromonospora vindobonensis TaxID=195748 RepID=A0ABW5VQM9_9MICO